jgi:prolyl oligopeptidase
MTYPPTRRDSLVETLHGVQVEDPYRWLEDADSDETKAWVEAQNRLTFGLLEQVPGRQDLKNRLTALWNFERFSVPFQEGQRTFYRRNSGLQNQAVLMVQEGRAAPRELLDPNTLSQDGTVALGSTAVTHDGRLLAYSISRSGSDWQEWRVRDVDSGNDLADVIQWSKFSGASWTKDGKGFFYSAYDPPMDGQALQQQNYFHKLYYHRLGTPQSEDVLVYHRPDQKEWGFGAVVSEDGRYLILDVWQGTNPENRVFYKDLRDPMQPDISPKGTPIVALMPEPDAEYTFLGNVGSTFYFQTNHNAPRRRIIAVDTADPAAEKWREVVPQRGETLEESHIVGGRLVLGYLKDAHSQIRIHKLDGGFERELPLPGLGTADGFSGKMADKYLFFGFVSFTQPASIYRVNLETGSVSAWRKPKFAADLSAYETKQVFCTSRDGTKIPLFITHKKGIKLNGTSPAYLYGYGGFKSSMTPFFSVSAAVWLEMGGVYAVACLRGGGEYGRAWHDAGRLKNKQNVFDDFIAAGEYLIANGYTSSPKLAIGGGSNGGLLVGACITQRPDLFGAALPDVGVHDMLRFHKFTIGWAWTSDYGSPDNPEDFKTLLAYSPYHNVKSGTRYPATMVTTSDHDDRVVPAHSYKFAAALQYAQAGDAPILIRVETKAGHGAGKPTSKLIEEAADRWAFLSRALGFEVPKWKQPAKR